MAEPGGCRRYEDAGMSALRRLHGASCWRHCASDSPEQAAPHLEVYTMCSLPAQQAPPVGDGGPAVEAALVAWRRAKHVRPHALGVP